MDSDFKWILTGLSFFVAISIFFGSFSELIFLFAIIVGGYFLFNMIDDNPTFRNIVIVAIVLIGLILLIDSENSPECKAINQETCMDYAP